MSASQSLRRRGPTRWAPAALAVFAALLAGCGGGSGPQRGNAFVFLTVEQFSVGGGRPTGIVGSSLEDVDVPTLVCVTIRNDPKNPGQTAADNVLDNVRIRSYTVTFTPSDGDPPPGPFTFGTSALVPTGGDVTFAVTLVPAQAKREPPLRPLPRLPFVASAQVVFEGEDGRGQDVETEGGLTVQFVGEGRDVVPAC